MWSSYEQSSRRSSAANVPGGIRLPGVRPVRGFRPDRDRPDGRLRRGVLMDARDESGLEECRETVEQLQVEKQELQQENEVLRESAEDFGELAERLNTALKESTLPNRGASR